MFEHLKGILPALMTAFDENGVNTASVQAHVKNLAAAGVHGLYVGGSSGEMVLCNADEREKLLESVMDVRGDMAIVAHVGAFTTADTVHLARHAANVGAQAVSSVTPLYYKYSFEEVKVYYQRIADAGLPVIIYNIPGLTGTVLGYDQLAELLSIPGVEGMKFTSSDFFLLNRIKASFPDKVIYNGSDEMLLSGLSAGADGGIGTTYNFMPTIIMAVYNRFHAGDLAGAHAAQTYANRIIASVLKKGVLPASKYLVNHTGVDYGICREPFLPLDEASQKDLDCIWEEICAFGV